MNARILSISLLTSAAACALLGAGPAARAQSPFATRVLDYQPAPGQFVNDPAFNDPSQALGPPIGGGTTAADNTKIVTLGGFGGYIILGFDHPVLDQPVSADNPNGLDVIVFGNAFFVAGNPAARWAECATIEVSRDENGNGLPDDTWYLIPGSYFIDQISRTSGVIPKLFRTTVTWDDNTNDDTFPPAAASWIPAGRHGTWTTSAFQLPADAFTPPLFSPVYGYADASPTLILGDTDGDNVVDDPTLTPDRFYTVPTDPFSIDITPGSGGGDAFDIAWAVSPITGLPANLPSIDFIRITTAVNNVQPLLGEVSAEVTGVAIVSTHHHSLADIVGVGQQPPPDGLLTGDDYVAFINAFFTANLLADIVSVGQEPPPDGLITGDDYVAFINAFFTGS